jgi:hypothetical protein
MKDCTLSKQKKMLAMVVKIDLSKAYDRDSWLYLRLMLIDLGFCAICELVMSCISNVSFFNID